MSDSTSLGRTLARHALAFAAGLTVAALPSAQAPRYTLEVVGEGTLINDMNVDGVVVGWVSSGGVKAFAAGPSHPHQLLPLPEGYSSAWAQGINDQGVIVGSAAVGSYPEFGRAVAWYPDGTGGYTPRFLGELPGHDQSVAYDVNNRGDIVGQSIPTGFQGGPTVWFNSPSGVLNLSTLGAPSGPKEINDEGVLVGISGGLFDLDTLNMTPLPPFSGGITSFQGWAIDDAGGIAGTAFLGGFVSRAAARWTAHRGWQLVSGIFNASALVQAFDLHDAGITVLEGPQPAAHFDGLGTYALASLLEPQEGQWTFVTSLGEAVNERGQIAAIAFDSSTGQGGVVVMTPVLFGASASFRNAGTNPASYVAGSDPALGSTLSLTVDLTTTGHTNALVAGSTSFANLVLQGGQVLLIGGSPLSRLPLATGPLATLQVPIPADPALAGVRFYTQAGHLFGKKPFALSNALDLTLGY